MKIHSFNVIPNLPENLKPLAELSQNMWFTWNWDAIMMFVGMDEKLYRRSHRNPKWILGKLDSAKLNELSNNPEFVAKLNAIYQRFLDYKNRTNWYKENGKPSEKNMQVAYFSMEFGIGEGLPMYSGGLGILSGDHLKSASDLGMPLIAVGLLYQKGYIQQVLNRDGWQVERYPENDWANMPVEPARDRDGNPLHIDVPLGNENIKAAVWRVPVGRTSLYLLDTNLPENPPHHRLITEQLYGGDRETRIRQEIVLGLGGVKALRALGMNPTVYHINEGHAAFLLIERIRETMHDRHCSFEEAREIVWASSVFTTHTPVIAGNEHFDPELVRKYMETYVRQMGLSWEFFLSLGKEEEASTTFCMTVLALRLSAYLNGVAKLHGEVSKDMWRKVWPELPYAELPITSITNGIHVPSWISHEMLSLYKKYMMKPNVDSHDDPAEVLDWNKMHDIPDHELWDAHETRKQKLITVVRDRYKRQLARLGADTTVLDDTKDLLSPKMLTIGFARRFATYKRATLIFRNPDRLAAILNNPEMPIQLVFAGKAHQADTAGKELVKTIAKLMDDPRFKGKLVFIEDYNMNVARYMVQGVDVWLNNPTRPMEASGTSGMKSTLNAVLNLSVLDGWWAEAYNTDIGWGIGGSEHYKDDEERDNVESAAICNLIEKEIAPLYYDRAEDGLPHRWISMMKRSVSTLVPFFNTSRMVKEYYQRFYSPAHAITSELLKEGRAGELTAWRNRITENWEHVSIKNVSERIDREVRAGDKLPVKAEVSLGGLSHNDVDAQIYVGKLDAKGELAASQIISMRHTGHHGDVHTYEGEITACSGRQDFALRVLPKHDNIANPYTPLFIAWED